MHTNRSSDWNGSSETQEDLAFGRVGSLGLVIACLGAMAVFSLSGCSGGVAHAVNSSEARTALATALDHWKLGENPRTVPTMTIQDFEWESGAKLLAYEIADDGQPRDANLSIKARLTLAGKDGKGKPVNKTVNYLVGTSPSVTVFRDMLKH